MKKLTNKCQVIIMAKQMIHGATRNTIYDYTEKTFGTQIEYPWRSLPNYAVLRRSDNKKWYAIIMDVPKNKLGLQGKERIDILDIKCNPVFREMLLAQKGFLPAYHLNRENWITVLLDGTVDNDIVFGLLDESYKIAKGKSKNHLDMSLQVGSFPSTQSITI